MMRQGLCIAICCMSLSTFAAVNSENRLSKSNQQPANAVHLSFLMNQPSSNNLLYAVSVHGLQPTSPNWVYHYVNPGYSPAFNIGYTHLFADGVSSLSIDWDHLNSSDHNSAQVDASLTSPYTQFVAPPYDVGPQLFANKHASSVVNFYYDRVSLDTGRLFTITPHLHIRLFAGINFLRIKQTITSTFDQNAGAPLEPGQMNLVPANPNWYFITKNTSLFTGGGPDAGVNLNYISASGFGIKAKLTGVMAAGQASRSDKFTSTIVTIGTATNTGINKQSIAAPNNIELVPGVDTKIGFTYTRTFKELKTVTIEIGYRFATYFTAILEIAPQSLVQVGTVTPGPSFIYGSMGLNNVARRHSKLTLNGPYIKLDYCFS